MQRFSFDGNSLGTANTPSDNISGIIRGLAVDQFESDLTWFVIPQNDIVGYAENLTLKYLQFSCNRPRIVSLDPAHTSLAWIADSSRVTAIDTSGKILASIKGFEWIGSVSANSGSVWISDRKRGEVRRFRGPFQGNAYDMALTVEHGDLVNHKFELPISISALTSDGGAWVVDRDAGRTFRLDSTRNIIASGTGLILPNLSVTLQKAE